MSKSTRVDDTHATLATLKSDDEASELARAAGELQNELRKRGDPLAARDAFVARTAMGLDERLVVADFDADGISDPLSIAFLRFGGLRRAITVSTVAENLFSDSRFKRLPVRPMNAGARQNHRHRGPT